MLENVELKPTIFMIFISWLLFFAFDFIVMSIIFFALYETIGGEVWWILSYSFLLSFLFFGVLVPTFIFVTTKIFTSVSKRKIDSVLKKVESMRNSNETKNKESITGDEIRSFIVNELKKIMDEVAQKTSDVSFEKKIKAGIDKLKTTIKDNIDKSSITEEMEKKIKAAFDKNTSKNKEK